MPITNSQLGAVGPAAPPVWKTLWNFEGSPPALGAGGWSSSGSPWFGCALEGILHFGGIFGYRCCGLDTSGILVMPVGTFGGFGDTPGQERQEGTVPAPGSKPL